jgi:YegS/Rv2252/BmrU family lipid kinase
MRRRIKVIGNPASGRGRAARAIRILADGLRAEGCTVEVSETQRPGDAERFARESRRFDAIACVGGDGTVHEVLNGPPPQDLPPLIVIPTGTANVLAKELRQTYCPRRLARLIPIARERPWDLGTDRLSGRRFLLFASAGFDAHVVHVFHATRKGTIRMWQYCFWGTKALFGYTSPRIRVEVDGRLAASAASWVLISNTATYGGPLVFTPQARSNNGFFEVMLLHRVHERDTPRMFVLAILNHFLGTRIRPGGVEFLRGRRVSLRSDDPVPVQMDGDPAGHLPVDLEITPGGVRVLTQASLAR